MKRGWLLWGGFFRGKSSVRGDPSTSAPSACASVACAQDDMHGWGHEPAYPGTSHSKVLSYAGSNYSPTPIVILSKHFRTNVRKCAPKDLLVPRLWALKVCLFNGSPRCGEGFFRGSPQNNAHLLHASSCLSRCALYRAVYS